MPQSWFRCSPEPVSFSMFPRVDATLPQLWHFMSILKNFHDCYKEISATQQKKYLTELQIEAKLTLMLGDKRVAQTAGEREVLVKDFRIHGIHSCWWEGLEELNLKIIALLYEWENLTHYYKSITGPFKHNESFAENMPSGKFLSYRIFFFNFTFQFSLLCYLLFKLILHIHL